MVKNGKSANIEKYIDVGAKLCSVQCEIHSVPNENRTDAANTLQGTTESRNKEKEGGRKKWLLKREKK